MKVLSPRPAHKRGQSLAEMAVVIPVLVFLLMGGFDASVMISDKITAGYAVRQGARLAAEIGGLPNTGPHTPPACKHVIPHRLPAAARPLSAAPTAIDTQSPPRADRRSA